MSTPAPGPVFIIGLARSGTNLLARMLGRHAAVSVALDPAMPLFKALRNAVVAAEAPAETAARFDPGSAFHDYYFAPDGPALLQTILSASTTQPLAPAEVARLTVATAARARLESAALADRLTTLEGDTYHRLLASLCAITTALKPGATIPAIKEVWVIDFVPMLARMFPAARFYVIDRDPRAIIASLLSMAERDPTQAAHVPSYLRHWRKNVALTRRFEVDPELRDRFRATSYEALVADPESEARRLCAELELAYDPEMLALSADGWTGNSSFGEGRDIYRSSAQRWRARLETAAIATADFLCAPEMALTAYEPAAPPRLDEEVLSYLAASSCTPGSWRSDSGDAVVDVGGELLRHALVASSRVPDESLVRRCFLFPETFEAVRVARTPAPGAARRQMA
jgi:hypothetical protein